MKLLFLCFYLVIQITVVHAFNQYLGCFIDRIGDRDLNIFLGDYEQITPEQCILACEKQNYLYAAIQYGNECRCGQQYGRYGRVSDDECYYLCATSEKCGGDYRNSVYKVGRSKTELSRLWEKEVRVKRANAATDSLQTTDVSSMGTSITSPSLITTDFDTSNSDQLISSTINDASTIEHSSTVISDVSPSTEISITTDDFSTSTNIISVSQLFTNSMSSIDIDTSETSSSMDTTVSFTSTPTSSELMSTMTSSSNSVVSNNLTSIEPTSFSTIITTESYGDSSIITSLPDQETSSVSQESSSEASTIANTLFLSNDSSTTSFTNVEIQTSTVFSFYTDIDNNTSTSTTSTTQTVTSITTTTTSSSTRTATSTTTSSSTSATRTSTLITTTFASTTTSSSTTITTSTTTSTTSSSTVTGAVTTGTTVTSTTTSSSTPTTRTSTSTTTRTTTSTTSSSTVTGSVTTGTTVTSTTISSSTSTTRTSTSTTTRTTTSTSSSLRAVTFTSTSATFTSATTSSSTSTTTRTTTSITSSSTSTTGTSTLTTVRTTTSTTSSSTSITRTSTSTIATATTSATSSSTSTRTPSITTTTSSSTSTTRTSTSTTATAATIITSSSTSTTRTSTSTTATATVSTTSSSAVSSTSSSTTIGFILTSTVTSTLSTTSVIGSSTSTTGTSSSTSISDVNQTTVTTSFVQATTTVSLQESYLVSSVIIVPSSENFAPDSNATREIIRTRLDSIIDLGFLCLSSPSSPNCTANQRRKRQCSGYDVVLVSNITEVADTGTTRLYRIYYYVIDSCDQNTPVSPTRVQTAVSTLTSNQIRRILLYDYEGDLVRSTTRETTDTPPTDRKLWIIGAVLGPVAFVLLLVCTFCYLHYKCRPRPTNRTLAKTIANASQASAKTPNYQTIGNEPAKDTPVVEKNLQVLTQNDPLIGVSSSTRRVAPTETEKAPSHPPPTELSMDEIRRQNEVERWRNKLRLQEKFQQSAVPNPSQYNNQAYEPEPLQLNLQPAPERLSTRSTEVQTGRTKLHRLLDEVLDKADDEEVYNPDSESERQKRRRQRRRLHSNETRTLPLNPQTPHIPVIPQVLERPDSHLVQLRHNPYEAGDRAHEIARLPPIELRNKYPYDDQRSNPYSSRSNPPLFSDDASLPDRAATATNAYANPKRFGKTRLESDREATMRLDGGQIHRRSHQFQDDAVYLDTIPRNRNDYHVQARTAWVEAETDNDYLTAKRSIANTKSYISSIHENLQHRSLPQSDEYHA